MNCIEKPSPNFDERGGAPIDMLVLHYTGMPTGKDALERMCDGNTDKRVSAHYMVEEDGTLYKLVEERNRAWHAGLGTWRGYTDINARSIGIEIVNPGHEFGYRAFPDKQMEAVAELCRSILSRYDIPPRNVVGHSDTAPSRKEDPGELFDWKMLAEQGIGLWPVEGPGEAGPEALQSFGYDTSDMGKAITAFQRHFCPETLGESWNSPCGKRLAGLLKLI